MHRSRPGCLEAAWRTSGAWMEIPRHGWAPVSDRPSAASPRSPAGPVCPSALLLPLYIEQQGHLFGGTGLPALQSSVPRAVDLLDDGSQAEKLCFPMSDRLDGMAVFVAVAEAKGFRAAGERLGVSGSAVSRALRRLEERLGVALVRRTARSVRLTPAGELLYAAAHAAHCGQRPLRSPPAPSRADQIDGPRSTNFRQRSGRTLAPTRAAGASVAPAAAVRARALDQRLRVARDGIEPPTRGFSVRTSNFLPVAASASRFCCAMG